jgi:hypothetical protein
MYGRTSDGEGADHGCQWLRRRGSPALPRLRRISGDARCQWVSERAAWRAHDWRVMAMGTRGSRGLDCGDAVICLDLAHPALHGCPSACCCVSVVKCLAIHKDPPGRSRLAAARLGARGPKTFPVQPQVRCFPLLPSQRVSTTVCQYAAYKYLPVAPRICLASCSQNHLTRCQPVLCDVVCISGESNRADL